MQPGVVVPARGTYTIIIIILIVYTERKSRKSRDGLLLRDSRIPSHTVISLGGSPFERICATCSAIYSIMRWGERVLKIMQ